jgi:hypothetical protein
MLCALDEQLQYYFFTSPSTFQVRLRRISLILQAILTLFSTEFNRMPSCSLPLSYRLLTTIGADTGAPMVQD